MFENDTEMSNAFSTSSIAGAKIGTAEEDELPKNNDVVFDKGMKLTDFLRANPNIRAKDEVLQYYSEDVVQRAIRIGAVAYMRGRLVL